MRALITGANGTIGSALAKRLPDAIRTDVETMDVTVPEQVWETIADYAPSVIFHLAGAKHAPDGELDPETTARININGTANVLRAATAVDARVVFASTCKAADPETVYGASKLIAERLVLNAGGIVLRYYNVPEASGNVFRLWELLPADAPIPVCKAWRYFVPLERIVDLTERAVGFASGRYAPISGKARWIPDVARELYPGRALRMIPLRRGDRYREPLHAAAETLQIVRGDCVRIAGPHDPSRELRVAA